MRVIFRLRTPGRHHDVWDGEFPCVPRVAEYVVLPGEDCGREVHTVSYDVEDRTATVSLRD